MDYWIMDLKGIKRGFLIAYLCIAAVLIGGLMAYERTNERRVVESAREAFRDLVTDRRNPVRVDEVSIDGDHVLLSDDR